MPPRFDDPPPSVAAWLRAVTLPIGAALVIPALLVGPARIGPALHAAPLWRVGVGGALVAIGLALLLWTNLLFARIGRGTLAPWAPTQRLVARGPYRHLRNPMISGVLAIVVGEAIALSSSRVGAWAACFFVANHLWFVRVEEPGLLARFGEAYARYRDAVPRWVPRLRAWRGDDAP